ncbi:MAG TPA: hypothetical protein VIH90_06220 [Candidatus Saccharimonadales bacterium]
MKKIQMSKYINRLVFITIAFTLTIIQVFGATASADLSASQTAAFSEGATYLDTSVCDTGGSNTASATSTTSSSNSTGTVTATDVSYSDSSRGNRQVGATVYSPGDGKPHPLIIFAPGRFQNSTNTGFYTRYLNSIAQKGFVVAGANFPDNNSYGAVPNDAADIKFLITQVEADSKFSSSINTANGVGLIGHSDGGMVAMLDGYASGLSDPRITAIMAEDGAWYPGYNQVSGPPLLLMHGSNDTIQNISSSQSLFASTQGPYQGFATVLGADHYHYIVDTTSQYIPAVDGLTTAFFNRVLGGDISSASSLSGIAQQYPGLVSFQEHGNETSIVGKAGISTGSGSSQCCGASVGGPSQGGPLIDVQFPQVADTAALATNIDNYVKSTQPSSPFVGMGAIFVEAGQKYGVNPALMVAIAQKESSLGLNQDSGSYDAWGLTAQGDVANYPYQNGEYYFPSWTIGIYESSKYVGNNYAIPGSSLYSTTVEQLMTHYTPGDIQNQTQITLGIMNKIVAGLAVSGGGGATTGVVGGAVTGVGGGSGTTTTASSGCGSSSASASGLTNPFPDGWTPNRLDMGYDGAFKTEIVAPCSGTMSYVDADTDHSSNGGWEGAYFTLKCSQQPNGIPTDTFYFAEGVSPTVTQGQTVTTGQQIGVPGWTGYSEGAGGIEWGLAVSNVPRETYAASLGNSDSPGSPSNLFVLSFAKWAEQNLNVAPPSQTNHAGGS